ncbi:MAG: hypothetical protein WC656_10800 [Sulfurimonas sp.]|jgi:hypothetical protein
MKYIGLKEVFENIKTNFQIIGDLEELVSDGSKIISTIKKTRELIIKSKIKSFIESFNKISNIEINEYIKNIEDDENKKTLFVEALNKVIDLDDDLQIYMMAYLVKIFSENNGLNYYEKQLFYNLATFSRDDFKIFYCIYLNEIKEDKKYFYLTSYIKTEIMSILLNKFAHLGFIHIETRTKQDEQKNISNHISYTLSEYSQTLFLCLERYFMNESCDDIIEKREYAKIKGGFNR